MLALVSFGLCSALFVAVVFFAAGGEGIFPFHPIFFAIGFIMCTINAINVMQIKLAPVANFSRKGKGQLHGVLQLIGFTFMVRHANFAFADWSSRDADLCRMSGCFIACVRQLMGFGAIYGRKEERKKPHLTTWHAWIGIAALGWMGLNVLGGLFNTVQIAKMRLNWVWSDKLHGLSGRLAASVGLVAVATGLWSNWATRHMGVFWQTVLTLVTSVILATVTIPLLAGKPAKKLQ
jgi:hypothetical protein